MCSVQLCLLMTVLFVIVLFLIFTSSFLAQLHVAGELLNGGEYPWTYDNDLFGGPDFWGLMHRHWRMCKTGKLQSPINIDPEKLVFDPGLSRMTISRNQLDSVDMWNTGQFPLLVVANGTDRNEYKKGSSTMTAVGGVKAAAAGGTAGAVTVSGGPAYPYNYQFHQLIFHFGDIRNGERGSEHTIDRVRFPAEIQLLSFNTDLYENFTQAQSQPRGLLAISIIVDVGDKTNSELKRMTNAASAIRHRGEVTRLRHFQLAALLPANDHYVTYEGSLTFPGCYETVTWIIYNSPIYINAEHLTIWAELVQSEKPTDKKLTSQQQGKEKDSSPPIPLGSNYRPLKASNGRLLRTNINVHLKPFPKGMNAEYCPSNVYMDMGYRSNTKRAEMRKMMMTNAAIDGSSRSRE